MEDILAMAAYVEVSAVILEGYRDDIRTPIAGDWRFWRGVELSNIGFQAQNRKESPILHRTRRIKFRGTACSIY